MELMDIMYKEKIEYYFSQTKDNKKTNIDIDLDSDVLEAIVNTSNKMGLTVSEFIEISLVEMLVSIEMEKNQGDFENIIDIYDFYALDDILDEIEETSPVLVINPNGKHVVLMSPYEYKVHNEVMKEYFNYIEK